MSGDTASSSTPAVPAYVQALQTYFGAPSQAAFGSAVFFERLDGDGALEAAAKRWYRYFVGSQWERFGEQAWMGAWQPAALGTDGAERDLIVALQKSETREVRMLSGLLLDEREDEAQARAALAAAADAPDVTARAVWQIGDGAALSGLLIGMQRAAAGEATFLVFLMD